MNKLGGILCIFVVWLLSSVYAVASDTEPKVKQRYIVATTSDDFVAGVLFDALAAKYGFSVSYKSYATFGDVLNAVIAGDADFAPNATYTAARAKQLFYSSPTNIEYTYLFSKQKVKLNEIDTLAVPTKTVFYDLIVDKFPSIEVVEYDDTESVLQMVNRGEVQAVVAPINYLTKFVNYGLNAEILNDQISIKPVSIVSRHGADARVVEKFVNFIHTESMQRLLHQSVKEFQKNIRIESLQRELRLSSLDLDKPIKIKLEQLVSYVQYDQVGSASGITADSITASCSLLDIRCEIVSGANETWEQMHHAFLEGEVDLLAPFSISDDRKKYAHFAIPHHTVASVLVKRLGYKPNVYKYAAELLSERIGVVREDLSVAQLSRLLPQKELTLFETQADLIKGLQNDEVDYISLDRTSLNRALRDDPTLKIVEETSIEQLYTSRVSFGFPKDERGAQLAYFFSRALQLIDLTSIVEKYDAKPEWRNLLDAEKTYAVNLAIMFLVFGLLSAGVMFYLNVQSNTDKLTGLKNRRALSRSFRNGMIVGSQVLYLDINHFKQINDKYGHAVGDLVLKELANKIKATWKGSAFRIGGDEFVLTGHFALDELDALKQQLSQVRVSTLLDVPSSLDVHISIGTATSVATGSSFQTILKDADQNMYCEKQKWNDQLVKA